MKNVWRVLFFIVAFTNYSYAQSGFNYQAVIRNNAGEVLANQPLSLIVSLIQDTVAREVVYSENHQRTTNSFGLVNLVVGKGEESSIFFDDIDWSESHYFIEVEIKLEGESDFKSLGISRLNAVPFAMHAETVSNADDADADPNNEIQDLVLQGEVLSISNNATATNIDLSTLPDEVDDADADPKNEIQSLSLDGDSIKISGGKGVLFPTSMSMWASDGENMFLPVGNLGLGSSTPAGRLEVKGNAIDTPEDLLFGVINNIGDTVFAVYQGGVRVNVSTIPGKAVGSRGGFAVGNLSSGKGVNDILTVNSDSVRIYLKEPPVKAVGSRGGFAVGNLSSGKSLSNNLMHIDKENYFIGTESGMSITTGLYNSFLGYRAGVANTEGNNNLFIGSQAGVSNTFGESNIFVGNNSGFANTTGDYNIFLGFNSGYELTGANNNIIMGYEAGKESTTGTFNLVIGNKAGYFNNGNYNVFLGYEAGYNNVADPADSRTSHWNTFIGYQAGKGNTTGWHNMALGYLAGSSNQTATNQLFIGNSAGFSLTKGYGNSFIGHGAGENSTDCMHNTFVGYYCGNDNTTGGSNTYIGYGAGGRATTGNNNVAIGYSAGNDIGGGENNVSVGVMAGYVAGNHNVCLGYNAGSKETGDKKLYIHSAINPNDLPLVYGEFDNRIFKINGDLQYTGTLSDVSDKAFKNNIQTLGKSAELFMQLNPVSFSYDIDAFPDKGFSKGTHFGFIAQEVELLYPELIGTGTDGYKNMNYIGLTPILVEVVQEQQKTINEQEQRIKDLESKMELIMQKLEMK